MGTTTTLDSPYRGEHPLNMMAPPEPRWQMQLTRGADLSFRLMKAPNRFHRLMQRLLLGIIWSPL